MLRRHPRNFVAPLLAVMLGACSASSNGATSGGGGSDGGVVLYLTDAGYRRAELVAELVNPQDGYAEDRLAHYATGAEGDWERLPEWNPEAERIAASELDAPGGAQVSVLGPGAAALEIPTDIRSEDDPRLVALGDKAFHNYPIQVVPFMNLALGSRAAASYYGLWIDNDAGVGGLVRARLPDGGAGISLTCSTCHEAPVDGVLVDGRPNDKFDFGAVQVAGSDSMPQDLVDAMSAWGPGRVDVTTTTGLEPVRIAELRPMYWLPYLHADATVHHFDRTSLAIRVETLLITDSYDTTRPPREISLALAAYLESLALNLPDESVAAAASPQGAQVFAQACARCHQEPGLTGPPVSLADVGTDPTIGLSLVRGTGTYRVPSLRGVGTRGALLHDGSVPSLAVMFDPARVNAGYPNGLHGVSAIPGHTFGLDLNDSDRTALIAYLSKL
ncbi:MAG: cytochrome c [Deltaproteobacteria bacterium]|nr:cytochrome c [Deltaproteobacteria bacterium]